MTRVRGQRAVVALSGGVDSAVAAALLLEQGWNVEAVSLRLWDAPRASDRICSDWRDAAAVADHLAIPHTVLDRRATFEREVVGPFVEGYVSGRTPNPCMACNSRFKLGDLLRWAESRNASHVATGHYARIVTGDDRSPRLARASDPARDQSYFLFELDTAQLARTLFPVGTFTKADIRDFARARKLPVADKKESQDLCFGSPADLVASRGCAGRTGEVVDRSGVRLGRHDGVERFTVGQRRGLRIPHERPLYVQSVDAEQARLVVGPEPPVASSILLRSFRASPGRLENVSVQVRHRARPVPASLDRGDETLVRVRFESPVTAPTPGQAAVVYRDDVVLGGGWIERVDGPDG